MHECKMNINPRKNKSYKAKKRWLSCNCRTTLMIALTLDAEIANISEIAKGLMEICCNSHARGFYVKHLGRISRAKILNTHTLNMPT